MMALILWKPDLGLRGVSGDHAAAGASSTNHVPGASLHGGPPPVSQGAGWDLELH